MSLPRITPYDLPDTAALPPSRLGWQLRPDRAALLVHDMQHYFCAPYPRQESPLAPVVANIARIIAEARAVGMPIFYTAQKGDQFGPDRGLQADLWGPGMAARAEDEAILPELRPEASDIVLHKHRYSAFQRSNLDHLLRARGRDQLVITGIYAHIGCLMTASEGFQRDVQPFVVADAQADFDRAGHDLAMSMVARCCGVVTVTDDVVARLKQPVLA